MARTAQPRVAWVLTGSGHYLKECMEIVRSLPGVDLFLSEAAGEALADLVNHGDRWLAARGGRGGRGNTRFLSNARRAPTSRRPARIRFRSAPANRRNSTGVR